MKNMFDDTAKDIIKVSGAKGSGRHFSESFLLTLGLAFLAVYFIALLPSVTVSEEIPSADAVEVMANEQSGGTGQKTPGGFWEDVCEIIEHFIEGSGEE